MNHEDEFNNKINRLFIIITIIGPIIIISLIYYISTLKTDIRIEKSEQEHIKTEKQIDSLESKRNEVIDTVLKKSQSRADRANQITKTVKHETILIRDTTYAAMCEYLSKYRP